ncbi:hypothetical protein [uncultured Clostridium sp.]|uniref:hypothetical protein n=1 Tax=uncultured Clostridium sp. TaxID=59620 RepID=UPI0028F0B0FA|nr:hypothetical protein [uncultured Clostridium sp.]
MIKQIGFEYKGLKLQEFDVDYSSQEYTIETNDMKITLDKFHFEELRTKLNSLHEEVN